MGLLELPDEMLSLIACTLGRATHLLRLHQVSKRFLSLDVDAAWREICRLRWSDKPRFRTLFFSQFFSRAHPNSSICHTPILHVYHRMYSCLTGCIYQAYSEARGVAAV